MIRFTSRSSHRSVVRGFAAVLLCAAAFGLAACGGGSDDSDQPSSEQAADAQLVVDLGRQLEVAYNQKDAKKACSLLDPDGLKEQFGTMKFCIKRVNAVFGQNRDRPEVSFDEVTVDGNTASAVAKSDNGETTYDFVKVDGKWRIDISADDDSASSPDQP